jgi:hypothetical protein
MSFNFGSANINGEINVSLAFAQDDGIKDSLTQRIVATGVALT